MKLKDLKIECWSLRLHNETLRSELIRLQIKLAKIGLKNLEDLKP